MERVGISPLLSKEDREVQRVLDGQENNSELGIRDDSMQQALHRPELPCVADLARGPKLVEGRLDHVLIGLLCPEGAPSAVGQGDELAGGMNGKSLGMVADQNVRSDRAL
ncbi:MAG: hypothetical protein ACJ76Y_21985 [Thermoanaerobaculia bacterium]